MGINDKHFKRHGRWLSENAKECTVKDNFHSLLSISKSLGIFLRPSPAGRTAPSIGLGFFLSVTATSAVRFFHPMDARWCCPSTVFSFSSTPLFLLFFNHVVFLLSASRSINCAASSEHTIAIIVCMFCGPIVLAHGCYMTREFRREFFFSRD